MLEHSHTLYLAAAAVAAATGPPLAVLSAHRTAAQPVPADIEDERALLGYLIREPRTITEMSLFVADDFTVASHQQAWRDITDQFPEETSHPHETDSSELDNSSFSQLGDWLEAFSRTEAGAACLEKAAPTLEKARVSGERVLGYGLERRTYVGRSPFLTTDTGMSRIRETVSAGRYVFATVWMALIGLLTAGTWTWWAAENHAWAWGAATSVALLGAASLVWSLVDYDTLYLDTSSFVVGAALSYTPLTIASALTGSWWLLALGVVSAAAVVALFLGANRIYQWLRGESGMGGGDSLIALATIGVPTAASGDPVVAYASLMASLFLSIAFFAVTSRKRGVRVPFAFGPFLASGWCAALAWWLVTS